jgi:hypothetical protein
MDISESFGWIILGFVPTLCVLEIAWKVGVVKKYKGRKVEEKEEKVSTNVP